MTVTSHTVERPLSPSGPMAKGSGFVGMNAVSGKLLWKGIVAI